MFNLGERNSAIKFRQKVQICLVGSVQTRSAHRLTEFAAFLSGFDVKYSRASAFWFFLSTTMVFRAFRTHFSRKNTSIFMLIGSLSRKKEISIKINYENNVERPWPSGLVTSVSRRRAGFDTQREQEFFLFFSLFFFFF